MKMLWIFPILYGVGFLLCWAIWINYMIERFNDTDLEGVLVGFLPSLIWPITLTGISLLSLVEFIRKRKEK